MDNRRFFDHFFLEVGGEQCPYKLHRVIDRQLPCTVLTCGVMRGGVEHRKMWKVQNI